MLLESGPSIVRRHPMISFCELNSTTLGQEPEEIIFRKIGKPSARCSRKQRGFLFVREQLSNRAFWNRTHDLLHAHHNLVPCHCLRSRSKCSRSKNCWVETSLKKNQLFRNAPFFFRKRLSNCISLIVSISLATILFCEIPMRPHFWFSWSAQPDVARQISPGHLPPDRRGPSHTIALGQRLSPQIEMLDSEKARPQ